VAWDLSRGNFHSPASVDSVDIEKSGIFVTPGNYKIRIMYDGKEFVQPVVVKPDPRYAPDTEGRQQTQELALKTGYLLETMARIYKQVEETKKAVKTVLDYSANLDAARSNALKKPAEELGQKLNALSKKIEPEKDKQGLNDFEDVLSPKVNDLLGSVTSTYGAPTQGSKVKYDRLKKVVGNLVRDFNETYEKEVARFQKRVQESGFTIFKSVEKLEMKE
jgi:hypothetical protein